MVDDRILGEALEMDLGDVALVVEGGGGSIAVDRELSLTSKNPVQNKVITAALGEKQDALTPGQNVTIIDGTISADVDSEEIAASVTDWLDDNVNPVGSAVVVDSSLSIEGAAADAAATGAAIRTGGSGLTEEAKQALLACFRNVPFIEDNDCYSALEDALYPPANLVSISAVFTQGSAVIYDTDSLDALKQYLTVTAYYDNSTTQTVTNYTLSGTLTVGTSTITVLYGGKTTTFTVTVTRGIDYTENPLNGIEWYSDYWYNTANGTLQTHTGAYCSDKFSVQDCLYDLISSNTNNKYVRIFLWDEENNFKGYFAANGSMLRNIQLKPNYKCAVQFSNSASDFSQSDISMMPVDNRATAVGGIVINLIDYVDAIVKNTYGFDIPLANFDIANYDIVYPDELTKILNSNTLGSVGPGIVSNIYVKEFTASVSYIGGTVRKLMVQFRGAADMTLEEMQQYIRENLPVIRYN